MTPPFSSARSRAWLGAATLAALGGCASLAPHGSTPAAAGTGAGKAAAAAAPVSAPKPASAASAAGTAGAAKPGAAPPARAPGSPEPFAKVTSKAKSTPGFLPLWTDEDNTWIEIPAEQLGKPFFFGSSMASGLGERFFLPGLMGREQVVRFQRAGNAVQLVAVNLHARAPDGTPLARAVAESYSDSLLASAPLAAAPHPQRQSLLVDARALLGGDLLGMQTRIETAFRLPYSLDRANSRIERARTSADTTAITVKAHWAVPKLPSPPAVRPGSPPPNPATLPNPPTTVPDSRSFFLGVAYTLAPLPAAPMKPRLADQRVGFFTEGFRDLGVDTGGDRRTHFIQRWRLEKKDPAAPVSEPKEPIRAVMDRNIPPKWRAAVRDGILEWNKAFERAGFRNAVVVEQQADDADWDSVEGLRILAVRWFAMEGPGAVAVGPSQSDPRTGEILRGAAIIPENWVRLFRTRIGDAPPRVPGMGAGASTHGHEYEDLCNNAQSALEQAQFGFALLVERGAMAPEGPQADRFIAGALKDVVMHEVGHAIGLRHNFRASAGVSPQQLRDIGFTTRHGVSNSVMDYNALNTPLADEPPAEYFMATLGDYDFWAIEYGYRELPAATERQELAAIANRSTTDPNLAYGTDEDLVANNDPLINQRDLGNDPMAFARRQMKLSRELWDRTQARKLAPQDDMTVYRRNLESGLRSFTTAVPMLSKYIGGTVTSRALAGSDRPLVAPVPGEQQRLALDILLEEVFSSASFRFEPGFLSRLGIDQFDRFAPGRRAEGPDFSLGSRVLDIQRAALDSLMSEAKAVSLADAETKMADPRTLPSYAEVQERLSAAVWSELGAKAKARTIDSLRRNLQREHVRRLVAGLVRPSSSAAADVRAVHRMVATKLEADLKRALSAGGWSSIARAHLADSHAAIGEALRAPLVKQGA